MRGRTPLSRASRKEAGGEDAPSPAPAKPALSLALQARRDRAEPGVAGSGAWTDTSARRPALPCGGKRPSAASPWVLRARALACNSGTAKPRPPAHGALPPSLIQVAAAGGCDSGAPGPERPGGKSWVPFMGSDSCAREWKGHPVALPEGSSCLLT